MPRYLSTKFVTRSETHSYYTRQNSQLNLPQFRTSAVQCAFRFRASKYRKIPKISPGGGARARTLNRFKKNYHGAQGFALLAHSLLT